MTPRQQEFVRQYLIDLNGAQAAIRAGYRAKTANQNAHKILGRPDVQRAIQEAMARRSERVEITADRVLKEIARIAFFDPRKLFDAAGNPLSITQLDADTAAVVAGLDIVEMYEEGEQVGQVKKWKLASKLDALNLAAKHLGLLTEKVEHSGGQVIRFEFGDDPVASPPRGPEAD